MQTQKERSREGVWMREMACERTSAMPGYRHATALVEDPDESLQSHDGLRGAALTQPGAGQNPIYKKGVHGGRAATVVKAEGFHRAN